MVERKPHEIAAKVKSLREERGLSQADTAEALGVDKSAISRIESGDRGLAVIELAWLAKLFDVKVDEILFSQEPEAFLMRAAADGSSSSAQQEAAAFADAFIDDLVVLDAVVR